ncbi:hypothetical protein BDB01DRAFT_838541 [Pilobolus umbonatus]|nr:hypothetical protein BDB01DRAFT_838541 [Pilobolus umbonatus]
MFLQMSERHYRSPEITDGIQMVLNWYFPPTIVQKKISISKSGLFNAVNRHHLPQRLDCPCLYTIIQRVKNALKMIHISLVTVFLFWLLTLMFISNGSKKTAKDFQSKVAGAC